MLDEFLEFISCTTEKNISTLKNTFFVGILFWIGVDLFLQLQNASALFCWQCRNGIIWQLQYLHKQLSSSRISSCQLRRQWRWAGWNVHTGGTPIGSWVSVTRVSRKSPRGRWLLLLSEHLVGHRWWALHFRKSRRGPIGSDASSWGWPVWWSAGAGKRNRKLRRRLLLSRWFDKTWRFRWWLVKHLQRHFRVHDSEKMWILITLHPLIVGTRIKKKGQKFMI